MGQEAARGYVKIGIETCINFLQQESDGNRAESEVKTWEAQVKSQNL